MNEKIIKVPIKEEAFLRLNKLELHFNIPIFTSLINSSISFT